MTTVLCAFQDKKHMNHNFSSNVTQARDTNCSHAKTFPINSRLSFQILVVYKGARCVVNLFLFGMPILLFIFELRTYLHDATPYIKDTQDYCVQHCSLQVHTRHHHNGSPR